MKTVVLVSGGGTNLQALLDVKQKGGLSAAAFSLVIASKPNCYALERAAKARIPTAVVKRRDYADLQAYDQALQDVLRRYEISDAAIVLAGFMTRLGPNFVAAHRGCIINIHPSLLPSFGGPGFYGLKPHEAVLEYGCKVTGATVHFVDERYDHGPIILQKAVAVESDDDAESLQFRVMREAEQVILPQALDLLTRGKLRLNGRHVEIET